MEAVERHHHHLLLSTARAAQDVARLPPSLPPLPLPLPLSLPSSTPSSSASSSSMSNKRCRLPRLKTAIAAPGLLQHVARGDVKSKKALASASASASTSTSVSASAPAHGVCGGKNLRCRDPAGRIARKNSSPHPEGKPLAPWAKRKTSDVRRVSIGKKDQRPELANEIPTNATSASRPGRQFAVANVGNNGRIYLRPSVKPAHQRYAQPSFVFPITPPGSTDIDALEDDKQLPAPPGTGTRPGHHDAHFTPIPPRTSTTLGRPLHCQDLDSLTRDATARRRAISDSTLQEVLSCIDSDADAPRLTIPDLTVGEIERPKTTDQAFLKDAPTLNIHIPTWRLGTPRFTVRGTPLIRGSSYAPSEDLEDSSEVSLWNKARGNRTGALPNVGPNNRLSDLGIPQACFPRTSQSHSLRLLRPARASYVSTHLVIEADMFTNLTFKPACDEKTIVRYSPNGTVTAATASRLVAEITSPSFLDYELLSDFFLTFRSFLEPETLLQMLIARLRWALARVDEMGMIVRVRAFVAIRHWILNYFIDDFVLDYSLRATFCTLLNHFVDELTLDAQAGKVQLKILGELKKCWRRICAHYWDGPDFAHHLGVETPIAPGGILGNRDPSLDPTTAGTSAVEPQSDDVAPLSTPNLKVEAPDAGVLTGAASRGHSSGSSRASLLILSHDPSSILKAPLKKPSMDVLLKPKTPVCKRGHMRNDSMSDPKREPELELPSPDADLAIMLQGAGRLVRGDLLPPGQPFVNVEPRVPARSSNRHTTIVRPANRSSSNDQMPAGATSGYGVKKLFNSVRRVLHARDPGPTLQQPSNGGLPTNTLTLQATGSSNPQPHHRRQGARPPLRIDLLGAEIAEDFRKAVREVGAVAQAERPGLPIPPKSAPARPGPQEYSAANMDSVFFDSPPEGQKQRPASDMAVVIGNKMMSPIDGTFLFENTRLRRGAPPPLLTSKTSSSSLMPQGGAPTPPLTPLTQAPLGVTPRRPSRSFLDPLMHLEELSPSSKQASPTSAQTAQAGTPGSRASDNTSRCSLLTAGARPHCPPPISGGLLRMQKRNGASNSHQSSHSRQQSSFASRLGRRFFSQNLDADRSSVLLDDFFGSYETAPRFTIRRRPGGDLRAVSNVEDLDIPILRTSKSAATLTTCTESIRSSYRLGSVPSTNPQIKIAADGDLPAETESVYSFHQPTKETPVKPRLSVLETPASISIMPPCFEEAAKKLAALTDDEDDGGRESALLKLEGRYRPRGKKSSRHFDSSEPAAAEAEDDGDPVEINLAAIFSDATKAEEDTDTGLMQPHERALWLLEGGGQRSPAPDGNGDRLNAEMQTVRAVKSFFSDASRESHSDSESPLLEGNLAEDQPSKRATTIWTDRSVLQFSNDDDSDLEVDSLSPRHAPQTGHGSHSCHQGASTPAVSTSSGQLTVSCIAEGHSFLDDESDAGSISLSHLSEDGNRHGITDQDVDLLTLPPLVIETQPPHPFGDPVALSRSHSPAVPMTMTQALEMGPHKERRQDQGWAAKPLPVTPTFPSIEPLLQPPSSSYYGSPPGSLLPSPRETRKGENYRKFSVHLPFILAFDSDVLAQQFTLIEKDALSDIDWKDLIEMNWKDSTTIDSRSWVEFLRRSNGFGVEVVIARFNLMVKWAISEIVITQHPEERARCIVKFIHIAAHCRRYRNFATLAQLAIALTSTEISRLSKTWELIPEGDMKTLKDLETLVTPTRNFYNLRAEMETGTDSGCIPFVGIYTHDLLFNAQRPSEVASSPTTPPLINFERYRIVASVVKTLLRLLEASTRYTFQPVEGITERCLWMSALSDDEIRRHSEGLE